MKFFHLSDLHIGKQLFQYSLHKEQEYLLKQIVEQAKIRKPDAILIAGDIYDKSVPSAEAVQIFDAFLTELAAIEPVIPVLLIAGNHDSAKRLDYAKEILKRENIYIAGNPPANPEQYLSKVVLEDSYGTVDFYLLPFMKPGHVRGIFPDVDGYDDAVRGLIEREQIDTSKRNVLLTHQFYVNGGQSPDRSDSEIVTVGAIDSVDVSAVELFDYVAMGHIHRMQSVKKECFSYSGTLFPYSVSEVTHEKGILEVELKEKGNEPNVTKLVLPTLRTVAALRGTLEEVVEQAEIHEDDYVSIVLTDEKIPYEAKETLESYFSHILEIRFDNQDTRELLKEFEEDVESTDPLDVFCTFFEELHQRKMNEEEFALVVEAVNQAKEQDTI